MYALVLLVVQVFVPGTLTLPLAGEVSGLQTLLSIGSLVFMLGLSVFLMVPVASAFTGLFLEDVADAVERQRFYPGLPAPTPVSFTTALTDSLRYFGLLIALNLGGDGGFPILWRVWNRCILGYQRVASGARILHDGRVAPPSLRRRRAPCSSVTAGACGLPGYGWRRCYPYRSSTC